MHRDLKADTTRPPAASFGAQQRRFDTFPQTFNQLRPHEALGQRKPAALCTASYRLYVPRVRPITYLSSSKCGACRPMAVIAGRSAG
jgi:hypothetical protein